MLTVVYMTNKDGEKILIAAFLMRSDAESFVRNSVFNTGMEIVDIDGQWEHWSKIKEAL